MRIPKTSLLLLLVIGIQLVAMGYRRVIYLDKEIRNAHSVREICVLNYEVRIDTISGTFPVITEKIITKMNYIFIDEPDSIHSYEPPSGLTQNQRAYFKIFSSDSTIHPIAPEGYWPALHDTILVVFDAQKVVSLFAHRVGPTQSQYQFWSPYSTSSWNTIFFANSPFMPVKANNTSTFGNASAIKNDKSLQLEAQKNGYQFGSFYHCIIDKNAFWQYLKSLHAN